jgi:hypothetical protein
MAWRKPPPQTNKNKPAIREKVMDKFAMNPREKGFRK